LCTKIIDSDRFLGEATLCQFPGRQALAGFTDFLKGRIYWFGKKLWQDLLVWKINFGGIYRFEK
jgi:hypothetical protein